MDGSEHIPLSLSGSDFRVSLEEVYRTEYWRLVNLVARVTGNRARAEELAAEALCRLSGRAAIFRPGGNLEAWLYRTAINLGLNALKSESRRLYYERAASAELVRNQSPAGPLDQVLRAERQHKVRSVLAALKSSDGKLLLLRHTGLSYQETAEALGLNPASVGKLAARATKRFKNVSKKP
ncbi:MAG: sigma-70 family RNA polymerase sigma factor [Acidobacteriia bacterium]|nr:sigma-70 family RNA polymerase sigma factor [Terriglobia bacterium]